MRISCVEVVRDFDRKIYKLFGGNYLVFPQPLDIFAKHCSRWHRSPLLPRNFVEIYAQALVRNLINVS